jgi:hypothetical protein
MASTATLDHRSLNWPSGMVKTQIADAREHAGLSRQRAEWQS